MGRRCAIYFWPAVQWRCPQAKRRICELCQDGFRRMPAGGWAAPHRGCASGLRQKTGEVKQVLRASKFDGLRIKKMW